MKKLFAIILGMALMFSGLTARAETASYNTQVQSEVEDGKLTLELLKQMSSWEELEKEVRPISTISWGKIENKEDIYCTMLIKAIDNKKAADIYQDEEDISLELDAINISKINYDRLMQKYQVIIDLYNASNNIQLVWTYKIVNENYIQLEIKFANHHAITQVGEKVILKDGATYWESAWNNGSGKYGIVAETNSCIPKDYIVTVNGFACYLDESGTTIVESYYKPYDKLKNQKGTINVWNCQMLHICTEATDLGWICIEDVARID